MFKSLISPDKTVVFPDFRGTRVMMMPFHVDDPYGTLPSYLQGYADMVSGLVPWAPSGVGYLTVDEAEVRAGDTHRRPGLHVDGVGENGQSTGAYGGGGGYATHGMVVAASVEASRGWAQSFDGAPGPDGDCSHLEPQLNPDREVRFKANRAYWCGPARGARVLAADGDLQAPVRPRVDALPRAVARGLHAEPARHTAHRPCTSGAAGYDVQAPCARGESDLE